MSRSDRLIERLLAGDLSAAEEQELRDRLRRDPEARARYDRLRALTRAAAGHDPRELSDAEMDRLGAAVSRRIGRTPEGARAAVVWRRPRGLVLWPAVGVAAAAALALVLWPRPVAHVGLRGGELPPLCTIEAYAVPSEPGSAATPRLLHAGDHIRLSDYLQFRYQSADPELRYLYVFGLDSRMTPLDYYPRPDVEQSVPIEPGDLSSLGRSIRLEKRHQPGPLKVVALCSRTPLARDAVLRGVATLRQAEVGVQAVDHVPVDGADATTVLDLEVDP